MSRNEHPDAVNRSSVRNKNVYQKNRPPTRRNDYVWLTTYDMEMDTRVGQYRIYAGLACVHIFLVRYDFINGVASIRTRNTLPRTH